MKRLINCKLVASTFHFKALEAVRMFGPLIRRKPTRSFGVDHGAFESTTFSLSTAVPRPSERRADERIIPMLRVAKLTGASG